jgi:hypothetical protein
MKPKIKLLFTAFLCSISSVLNAQSVNIHTAKAIAEHHLAAISGPSLKSTASKGKNFEFTSVKATVENNDTLYYILNDTINKGFVIVSADKRAWPILGYSTEGSFNEKKQPEAFTAWMENRKKEIESIKRNNLQPDDATVASWQNLSLNSSVIEATSVEPLIQTQWDQGCFYNSLCPSDKESPYCGHVPTGCTITAMAQIMKYWNYPTKGTGSHSYSHPTYGNLSADFGSTTYQWSQMPNIVTSQNDAVATLMYHCGVSLDAEYGPSATSAWDPRDELVQYFNYSSNAMLVNREGFTTSKWIQLLKSELDLQHPIWYTGGDSLVAHSFICDGYQDADYFHFNWGWSGSSDGYFYIGNLNTGWYSFNENQSALIKILPGNLPDGYNGFFLSSNAVDIATKGGTNSVDVCSSANWSASYDQSWLSLNTNTGGSGKTTLTLTATENQTGSDRSAKVTISAVGFDPQTITVNQLTKVNVTPGGLKKIMSKNATTITKFTLSGTIDARDFKTMRDAMPALTDVDLSEVTIVAYSGTEGPLSPDYRTYPANEIPENAFPIASCRGQNYFKSFILPSLITSIGSSSFYNCKFLTSINIPASVTNIGLNAFGGCNALINVDSANPNYSSIDGVLFNKNRTTLIHCPISKTGNYTIPSSVTSIIRFAFESCGKLSSITIPSSVTSVEELAFTTCSASINVDVNNPNFSGIDGVLFNKEQTELIQCPASKTGNYTIPSSVCSIGSSAFGYCTGLTNVLIPSSVISIGNEAFYHCSGLTTITIPPSVIAIKINAFALCSGLKTISIPSSVISIEGWVFGGCRGLHSIYAYSISPINLYYSYEVFTLVDKTTCTVYVPFGSKTLYATANEWKDFTHIVEMPGMFLSNNNISMGSNSGTAPIAISSISNWTAISDQTWLTISPSGGLTGSNTITITASANPTTAIRTAMVTLSATGLTSQSIKVTQYGQTEVTAGNLKTILAGQLSTITSLTLTGTIDARDFRTMRDEMPVLSDIDLSGARITDYVGTEGTDGTDNKDYPANRVPDLAFLNQSPGQGKINLNSLILPESVTSIGHFAFTNCRCLTNVNIPPLVTSIGVHAFNNCTSIATINIPSAVTSIDFGAFSLFNGVISVNEKNNKYSSIDGVLFNKIQTELIQFPTSRTGSYTIPSSVIFIGNYAFEYCSGLTNITIPSSVASIGNYAFYYCTGLTTLEIPTSTTSIGNDAFFGCSGLSELTIPSSVKTIGTSAFSYCNNLNSIFAFPLLPVDLNSSLGVFSDVNKNTCTLYVPYGSKIVYQAAAQWKDFKNIVELPNQAPVANSGTNQTTREGKLVTLNGTGSTDAEGNSLTFRWTAPIGITLNDTTVSKPTFTAPDVVTNTNYTFSLVVNDGSFDSPEDQVVITVTPNKAPRANAGIYQSVNENSRCTLNGSASSDPDKDVLTYLWTSPPGITLSSNTASKPTFTAPEVTTDTCYKFSLIVTDGLLNSTASQIVITVKNVDKAPYLKNPILDISADNRAPDQTIDLQTVFADDDLGDVISYSVTSNTNSQVVTAKIAGSNLTVSFSSQNTGSSEIEITANSNGKEVTSKFNVEVKIPSGIDLLVFDQNFMLYPNPTTGKLKLVFNKIPKSGISISVNDFTGKNCLKQLIRKNVEWIDLSGNVPGIYFIKTDQKNSKAQKVILK